MKKLLIIFIILFSIIICGCKKTTGNTITTVNEVTTTTNEINLPDQITLANNETFNIFELLGVDTTGINFNLKSNANTRLSCNKDGTVTTLGTVKGIKLTITMVKKV